MNKCYTCGEIKQSSEFNKNRSKPNGLNTICRKCSRERSKKYYRDNKLKHKEKVSKNKAKYIKRNRRFVWEYLSHNPCVDCGEDDILVLEFDHLRDKNSCISNMISAPVSIAVLELEIAKCKVRCSNCHKRKTARDFGNWKIGFEALK